MIDLYGSHFEFGGVSSRRYKLILANVDTDRMAQVSGSIEGVTVFNKKTKRRLLIDNNYANSPMTFEVNIITDDDSVLGEQERREIERWLFNRHGYQKFYVDMADDYSCSSFEMIDGEIKRWFMRCRFVNASRLEYFGGIVGYRATLEADSGYWWQDTITIEQSLDLSNQYTSRFTINVDSDIDDYIYPQVLFRTGPTAPETGFTVRIGNPTDHILRSTEFVNLPANTLIEVNGEINYITPSYAGNFVTNEFPRLLNGTNTITVSSGVSEITFRFNNRRML